MSAFAGELWKDLEPSEAMRPIDFEALPVDREDAPEQSAPLPVGAVIQLSV